MTDHSSSLQLKARDPDPRRSVAVCAELGAESAGSFPQRDTYFQGPRGCLRLREEEGALACLVADERLSLVGQEGRNWRFDIARPEVVLGAFSSSLGIHAVVVKERLLFRWEGVRIHLDDVQGLGRFIELQSTAIDEDTLRCARAKMTALCRRFEISDVDLTEESYPELIRGV